MRTSRGVWLRGCVLGLLALALAAPVANATFPGENGAFAVETPGFANARIWTMGADGAGWARLTGVETIEEHAPVWSADGRKVVFEGRTSRGANIYMANADGSELTQLTGDGDSLEPALSPDGRTIVFARYASGLHAMDTNGSDVRSLGSRGSDPSFSADGAKIVFHTQRNGHLTPDSGPRFEVAIMNADGSDQRVLAGGSYYGGSFSPDGSQVVFEHGDEVHVIGADGTGERDLGVRGTTPVFAPDGGSIAFVTSGPEGPGTHTVDLDGSNLRRLTRNAGYRIDWAPAIDPSRQIDWESILRPDPPAEETPPADEAPPADGAPPATPPAAGPSLEACSATTRGTGARDRLTGTGGGDVLRGLGGGDLLRGAGGDDCLFGGAGADRLSGGMGDDRLSGFRGDDSLTGGGGRDHFDAGTGRDRVRARDGLKEVVDCGPGRDVAVVDTRDVTRRCERVVRAAARR